MRKTSREYVRELETGLEVQTTKGDYIRYWRTALHLTYDDVAAAMGVHPITVRNWERTQVLKAMVRRAFDQAFRIEGKYLSMTDALARVRRRAERGAAENGPVDTRQP